MLFANVQRCEYLVDSAQKRTRQVRGTLFRMLNDRTNIVLETVAQQAIRLVQHELRRTQTR